MRWVAMSVMTLLACAPKSDGSEVASSDGTSAPLSGGGETTNTSTSSESSVVSSSTSSSTGDPTNDVKMDVFEPEPFVGECIRENDLQGSVEIDTPIGGLIIASAFWGWNWCCGPYPIVVLSEEDVLRVEEGSLPGLPSDQPAFLAMIDPEGDPPWKGEAPSRFSARRGMDTESTGWTRTSTIVSVLADPEPESETSTLEVAFAEDGEGWRVEGSIVAEYCPALEHPSCPCE
jgi:hypothetical protein